MKSVETDESKGLGGRKDRLRATILSAGQTIFLANGFSGTSMDDVARAAGVSKQTVYAHLQSKEQLFLAVIDAMSGGAGDLLADTTSDPTHQKSFATYLRHFARQQLTIVLTPSLTQLRRIVIAEVGRFPELGQMLYNRGPGRSIERLTRDFTHYQDKRQMRATDARQAASLFNWLVMGQPVNDAMLLGDDALPSEDKIATHADVCVRIFLAAFGV